MRFGIRLFSLVGSASLFVLSSISLNIFAQLDPRNHVVEMSARPDSGNILLTWRGNPDAVGYTIYRRAGENSSWDQVATLGGDATTWSDNTVSTGATYEYRIDKRTSGTYTGFGFVSAGIDVPITEKRGRVILVVESAAEGALSSELARFRTDLMGDGWQVIQFAVSSGDSSPSVRDRIRSVYNQNPGRTKAVFLIGHVPVPYSGNIAPDGHENHRGAWPADVYYGDMDGQWTDTEVTSNSAEREINWNFPGDGKFDQSNIPSAVELAVGRVDFWQMTSFANKTPSRSELDLLRAYFNKNHEFRHGRIPVERRGLILDNFGLRGTNAVSGSGWRNFSGFFGLDRVSQLELDTYIPTLRESSALFTWGAGGGSYYYSSGIGTSDDLALNDLRVIFTLWLGSYYGDWNNESNFLRAALGSGNILVSMFAGLPQTFLHPMAMGATIGDGLLLSQNNKTDDGYFPDGQGVNEVHISLHGDPTLRLHPVLPPRDLQSSGGTAVQLSWSPSQDSNVLGYHIFRSSAGVEDFQRITSEPLNATSFTDRPAAGDYIYQVRTVKHEQSGSGTYLNLSQAALANASTTGQTAQPPIAPSNLAAVAQLSSSVALSWTDASSDETSFRIERRSPSGNQFQEIANVSANITMYTDNSVLPSTTYQYRVRARNGTGDSPYSAEVQVTTGQAPQPTASLTYLGQETNLAGNWPEQFGDVGAAIPELSITLPPNISLTFKSGVPHLWEDATSDPRAVRISASEPGRIASAWLDPESVTIDFATTTLEEVALYFLDWDRSGRIQDLSVLDTGTGVPLYELRLENFSEGKYLKFQLQGAVTFQLTKIAGDDALLNALFVGGPSTGVPIPTPNLAAQMTTAGLNIRLTVAAGARFAIESSANFETWDQIGEYQGTGSPMEISIPHGLGAEFFRARML